MLLLFNRYLDSSQDIDITCELVDGFCMLIVHGRFFEKDIMAKLMLMFFNADIEPIIVQILSVFFETLIQHKKQKYFQLAVRETLTAIAVDKSFNENSLRSVLKFLTQAMMNESTEPSSNTALRSRLHNDLAVTLLTWMDDQPPDSKSLNVISKEILALRPLFTDEESKWKLIELVDSLLHQKIPKESKKNLKSFRETITQLSCTDMLLEFSSTRPADGVDENDRIDTSNDDFSSELENDSNGNCKDVEESIENSNSKSVDDSNVIDVPLAPVTVSVKRKRTKKVSLEVPN